MGKCMCSYIRTYVCKCILYTCISTCICTFLSITGEDNQQIVYDNAAIEALLDRNREDIVQDRPDTNQLLANDYLSSFKVSKSVFPAILCSYAYIQYNSRKLNILCPILYLYYLCTCPPAFLKNNRMSPPKHVHVCNISMYVHL